MLRSLVFLIFFAIWSCKSTAPENDASETASLKQTENNALDDQGYYRLGSVAYGGDFADNLPVAINPPRKLSKLWLPIPRHCIAKVVHMKIYDAELKELGSGSGKIDIPADVTAAIASVRIALDGPRESSCVLDLYGK